MGVGGNEIALKRCGGGGNALGKCYLLLVVQGNGITTTMRIPFDLDRFHARTRTDVRGDNELKIELCFECVGCTVIYYFVGA